MNRREFLFNTALGVVAASLGAGIPLSGLLPRDTALAGKSTEFSEQWLQSYALQLAKSSYKEPRSQLSERLHTLGYQEYRDIRYRPEKSIWKEEGSPFQLQLFHTGFLYKHGVNIYTVDDGQAQLLDYSQDMFSYGKLVDQLKPHEKGGFSGFRIHSEINQPGLFDEFCVFQGASYFRAVAAGQAYGLSARGLAIDTGQPRGEEFPAFRSFWIEQPGKKQDNIVVHALLDSISVVGVYKFSIRPGRNTVMKVQSSLYPRRKMRHVGVGPLTSMFMQGPGSKQHFDDFRPRIHDSEGLCIRNGKGELIWRPLINPRNLQFSSFMDENPQGFGLIQRERAFAKYEDLEAQYEKRPSLWIEPDGDWGRGVVQLIEIPTTQEIHDNIVAFWKPEYSLKPGQVYQYNYTLNWGQAPLGEADRAYVLQSRTGLTLNKDKRQFVIDFRQRSDKQLTLNKDYTAHVSASSGEVSNVVLQNNQFTGGLRLNFQYDPKNAKQADLRCSLLNKQSPASEVWVYRWES